MPERASLISRLNTLYASSRDLSGIGLRDFLDGDPRVWTDRDRWEQVYLGLDALTEAMEMIARDIDDLYDRLLPPDAQTY